MEWIILFDNSDFKPLRVDLRRMQTLIIQGFEIVTTPIQNNSPIATSKFSQPIIRRSISSSSLQPLPEPLGRCVNQFPTWNSTQYPLHQ